jgi:tRNA threonylcarbamoyladenosine biosynthesis protein TsaB
VKILAIDTTSKIIFVSLLSSGRFFSVENDVNRTNYEDIFYLIKKVLRKVKVRIEDIDCFGVCVGPGSFTGIRIGLAAVKGLAYSLDKPIVTYKSLDLLAWMLKDEFSGLLCIVHDARRSNIYSAVYSNSKTFKRIMPYSLTDISNLLSKLKKINKESLKIYFYGDAVLTYKDKIVNYFPNFQIIPPYRDILRSQAMISYIKSNFHKKSNSFGVLPFYMYPKDCQVIRSEK